MEEFKEVEGLKSYIEAKQAEYAKRNKGINKTILLNGHRLTNNDLFIQYAISYLKLHPRIENNLTLLVRQLAPTPQGLPVEVYTFTNTTVWAEYEIILSEIINHLISSVKYFDLKIYEESSGSDEYNVYLRNMDANK